MLIAFLGIVAIYGPRYKIFSENKEGFSSKCGLDKIKIAFNQSDTDKGNPIYSPSENASDDSYFRVPSFTSRALSAVADKPVKACWNRFKNNYTVKPIPNLIFSTKDMQNDGTMITQQSKDTSDSQRSNDRIKTRLSSDDVRFKITSEDISSEKDKHVFNTTSQPWYAPFIPYPVDSDSNIGSRWHAGKIKTNNIFLNPTSFDGTPSAMLNISEKSTGLDLNSQSGASLQVFRDKKDYSWSNPIIFIQGVNEDSSGFCIGNECLTQTDLKNIRERILNKTFSSQIGEKNVNIKNKVKGVGKCIDGSEDICLNNFDDPTNRDCTSNVNGNTNTLTTNTNTIKLSNKWTLTSNNGLEIKENNQPKPALKIQNNNNKNILLGINKVCTQCENNECPRENCLSEVNSQALHGKTDINIINTGYDSQQYFNTDLTFDDYTIGESRINSKSQWKIKK